MRMKAFSCGGVMVCWGLQTKRGQPAKGVVAAEIEAVTPKFIAACRHPPRALEGKLIISADRGTFQLGLGKLLHGLGCERAPVALGHDFQLPIERPFARAKNRARLIVNMTTTRLSKESVGKIFRASWLWANQPSTVRAEIRKMPTVWRLIVETGGEFVTKAMLDAELKKT